MSEQQTEYLAIKRRSRVLRGILIFGAFCAIGLAVSAIPGHLWIRYNGHVKSKRRSRKRS